MIRALGAIIHEKASVKQAFDLFHAVKADMARGRKKGSRVVGYRVQGRYYTLFCINGILFHPETRYPFPHDSLPRNRFERKDREPLRP